MSILPRRPDPREPRYDVTEDQRRLKVLTDTRKQVQKLADQINASLASYASRLTYR